MRTIQTMTESALKKRYFRATKKTLALLGRVVGNLCAVEGCEDWDQEEIIAATVHWMDAKDVGMLARDLGPHVATVRRLRAEAESSSTRAEGSPAKESAVSGHPPSSGPRTKKASLPDADIPLPSEKPAPKARKKKS